MSLNSAIPSTGITCANPKQRVPVGGDSTHPSSLHIPFWQPARKATRGHAFSEGRVTGDHKNDNIIIYGLFIIILLSLPTCHSHFNYLDNHIHDKAILTKMITKS